MLAVRQKWLLPVIWIIIIPLIAHLTLSWIGYNPTDDGFILSYSRRLLEGQIPHLDFISIRPIGSALFHIPEVALGGEATYWISRLVVWIQFGTMTWVWNELYRKAFEINLLLVDQVLIGLSIFSLSVNSFPIMAWHSIDALFFTTIGLGICIVYAKPKYKLLGYALLGLAYMARQNFIFMIPLVLILLGDWKRISYWIATTIPGILYVVYLLATGALSDAFRQLSSQGSSLLETGLLSYLSIGIIGGVAVGLLTRLFLRRPTLSRTAYIVMLACLVGSGIALGLNLFQDASFFLFGFTAGLVIDDAHLKHRKQTQIGCLSLGVTWCVSISLGYNYPALAAGTLAAYLIYSIYKLIQSKQSKQPQVSSLRLVLVWIVIFFCIARVLHVYRGRTWLDSNQSIAHVYPGTKYIQVDNNTYQFLADMDQAIQQAGSKYALLPDMAGYWASASVINPLPIDWSIDVELNNTELMKRVTNVLDTKSEEMVIIVQKVIAGDIAFEEKPLVMENDVYSIISYIQTNLTKIGETRYFELYR